MRQIIARPVSRWATALAVCFALAGGVAACGAADDAQPESAPAGKGDDPAADPCQRTWNTRDSRYCGSELGALPDVLYRCVHRRLVAPTVPCANGCVQSDFPWREAYCAPPPEEPAKNATSAPPAADDSAGDVALPTLANTPSDTGAAGHPTCNAFAANDGGKVIVIDLSDQRLWACDGATLFLETPISSGKPGFETPAGTFYVLSHIEGDQMTAWYSETDYYDEWVPWVSYFTDLGHAIHQGDASRGFASHGCIRVPPGTAETLWWWIALWTRVEIVA